MFSGIILEIYTWNKLKYLYMNKLVLWRSRKSGFIASTVFCNNIQDLLSFKYFFLEYSKNARFILCYPDYILYIFFMGVNRFYLHVNMH